MLDKHLIASVCPLADEKNIIYWKNYRITVLQDRLFRLEYSENKKFRDTATLSVFYRNMPPQNYTTAEFADMLVVTTCACKLIVKENRDACKIELNGKRLKIDNANNLKGTYRTLDGCDGDLYIGFSPDTKLKEPKKIVLGAGVCSRSGVAVFDDAQSLTLSVDGEVKSIRGDGSDEYIFAYGHDYRAAINALYLITGKTPIIPRYALGNWWSRYYAYTDKSYLRLLNLFDEQDVPLTVATIDMDWHYSTQLEENFHIVERGRNTEFYGGNDGWTGYTWNKALFPDYRSFLKKVQEKNLRITLNLHPADGVRWWEDCYESMAERLGRDATSGEWIKFDIADTEFINAYFSVIHKPYEKDGVDFWWIDWQQGEKSNMDGLDPLWSLNHYHYLDNGKDKPNALILSRYCGIGSHRYPLGFSGDTAITWNTLNYLPYFTATASNIGYTWWSHDIGGHVVGEKDNEQYLRHIQYGVFSPINRLHCCNVDVCTKEPWAYGNGAGEIAKQWLRFRHKMIPYLYTASYKTNRDGIALIEPLYYEWDTPNAYKYKNEYLFGGHLLVIPVTRKQNKDGFAYIKAWLPKGTWTDIFTGAQYEISEEVGKELTLLREMESIPVLMKAGGILPLSLDKGNSVENPEKMELSVYSGNGEYTLYEDGATQNQAGALLTHFATSMIEENGRCMQQLTISAQGDWGIIPKNRVYVIKFKDIQEGKITVYRNGKHMVVEEYLTDCTAVELAYNVNSTYTIEVDFIPRTKVQKLVEHARRILLKAKGQTSLKNRFWKRIRGVHSVEGYLTEVENATEISKTVKKCLTEIF